MPAIPAASTCWAWAVRMPPGTNGVRKAHWRLVSFCMSAPPDRALDEHAVVDQEAPQDVAGYDRVAAAPSGGGDELVDGDLDGVAALGADDGVAVFGRAQATGDDLLGSGDDPVAGGQLEVAG